MFDWTWAVGVLYQNHLHGCVRVSRYAFLAAWTAWAPPLDGLVRLDRLGSALNLSWAPPWICERIYFMIYIQDYARDPGLTIIGKKVIA